MQNLQIRGHHKTSCTSCIVFGNIDSLEILSHYISERAILEFSLWLLRQVGLPAFHHGGLGLFTLVSIVIIISLVIFNSIISLVIIGIIISLAITSFVVINQQQLRLLLNQSVILPYKNIKKILKLEVKCFTSADNNFHCRWHNYAPLHVWWESKSQ